MDIKNLEKEFLGKPIITLQEKFGSPQKVYLTTEKDFEIIKKHIYDEFSVLTKNDVCTGFSRRVKGI